MGRTSDARQKLMDAANALIWEGSYGSVTIDAICMRASVKKGSFYYFFESKPDLAITAINDWWRERKAWIRETFRPEVPPLERLRNYIDAIATMQLDAYETHGHVLGCPIYNLGTEISTQDERLRLRVNEILTAVGSYFAVAIRDAQDLGEIGGTDAPVKARALFTYYEGILSRCRIENDPEPLRTLSSDVLEMIGARELVAA